MTKLPELSDEVEIDQIYVLPLPLKVVEVILHEMNGVEKKEHRCRTWSWMWNSDLQCAARHLGKELDVDSMTIRNCQDGVKADGSQNLCINLNFSQNYEQF